MENDFKNDFKGHQFVIQGTIASLGLYKLLHVV